MQQKDFNMGRFTIGAECDFCNLCNVLSDGNIIFHVKHDDAKEAVFSRDNLNLGNTPIERMLKPLEQNGCVEVVNPLSEKAIDDLVACCPTEAFQRLE